MNNATVIVLLSTYNGEKYLNAQLMSILNQRDIQVKLIIRDDGSTDSTIQLLKKFMIDYRDNINCCFGENLGIHKSYDYLYRHAPSGDYYAFADEDDVWDTDKLSIAIQMLEKNNADFYASASSLVDKSLKPLYRTTANKEKVEHYQYSSSKILSPGAQGCTIVITNKLRNLLITYTPSVIFGHDTYITIVAYYLVKCVYDNQSHMKYRQHDNSWTGNRTEKYKQWRRDISHFLKGLERYSKLAKEIIDGYEDLLEKNDYELLNYLQNSKHSLRDRAKLFFMRDFRKYGLIQTIVFKIALIFGQV
ncbi:MAG: glycosyltransferase [Eubacteriales bacterium]